MLDSDTHKIELTIFLIPQIKISIFKRWRFLKTSIANQTKNFIFLFINGKITTTFAFHTWQSKLSFLFFFLYVFFFTLFPIHMYEPIEGDELMG